MENIFNRGRAKHTTPSQWAVAHIYTAIERIRNEAMDNYERRIGKTCLIDKTSDKVLGIEEIIAALNAVIAEYK